MCDLSFSTECEALGPREANKPIMFMATITAPALSAIQPGSSRAGSAINSSRGAAVSGGAGAGALARGAEPGAAPAALQSADVCCLEGCGLGWRVRPPLRRRGPWEVVAQRMKLCVEAVGGAKIEKLYTLLDHHELAPRSSYEVCIGDLHAGDACHLPILVRLPALASPTSYTDVVRFSLTYVDALKIDTKTTDICAGIARVSTALLPRTCLEPSPPCPLARDGTAPPSCRPPRSCLVQFGWLPGTSAARSSPSNPPPRPCPPS